MSAYTAIYLQLLKTMKFRLTTDELVTKYGITITLNSNSTTASYARPGGYERACTMPTVATAVAELCRWINLSTEASTDDLIKRYRLDVVSGCGYAKATSPSGLKCTSTSREDAVTTVASMIYRSNEITPSNEGYVATPAHCPTLLAIEKFSLLVRPSVLSNGWIAGRLKGITGYVETQAYCYPETTCEGATIEEAVARCVEACKTTGWRAMA